MERVAQKRRRPASWEEALQEFLLWKQAQGLAESTLQDYRYHVSKFFRRYPQAYQGEDLKKCVLEYMGEKMKPATFNIRLSYLKAFFAWCVSEGIFPENPLQGFKKRKAEGRIVNLDVETLQRLLALPNKKTFSGLRDYALMLLTLDTGIRPKEAFSLLVSDFDFRSMVVHVRAEAAKTRVSRFLPISPVTVEAVKKLIAARHPAWDETVPVFCSQDGNPLNRDTWAYRMGIYSRQLGVKVRPYDLRHAFALQFLRNGGQALALQRLLGHTDLTMTKRYVALTQGDVKAQHRQATPLNTLVPRRHRVRTVKT